MRKQHEMIHPRFVDHIKDLVCERLCKINALD